MAAVSRPRWLPFLHMVKAMKNPCMECKTVDGIDRVNSIRYLYTVITLNIGTPRPATVVVLNIKQFNFTLK